MGTFGNSFTLVKESMKVLKSEKSLLLFPIISGIVTVLLFLSFILPLFVFNLGTGMQDWTYALFFFLFYFLSYFIVTYFNTGLVACAHMRLNGKDPKFSDGISAANKHIWQILGWAMISGTVGLILRIISDRSRLLGKIIVAIIGSAWTLLTFFVIPGIIVENKGVFSSLKDSASLFKKTWGENMVLRVGAGFFFFILALIGLVPLVLMLLYSASAVTMIIIASIVVLYWLVLAILSSSMSGIFTAALYTYAKTGKVPSAFSADLIKNACVSKN